MTSTDHQATQLFDHVYSTGVMDEDLIGEQSMVIDTKGGLAKKMFKESFKEKYIEGGVGAKVNLTDVVFNTL